VRHTFRLESGEMQRVTLGWQAGAMDWMDEDRGMLLASDRDHLEVEVDGVMLLSIGADR